MSTSCCTAHLRESVPRMLPAGVAPEQLDGQSYTVMTLLPGQPFSAVSACLSEGEIFRANRQMGSILAALAAGRDVPWHQPCHALERELGDAADVGQGGVRVSSGIG